MSGLLSQDDLIYLFTYNNNYSKMYSYLLENENHEFNLLKMMFVVYFSLVNRTKSSAELQGMFNQVQALFDDAKNKND